MWIHVQTELEQIFAANIYPALLSDRYYRDFLAKAGFGPNFACSLSQMPQSLRHNLIAAAQFHARIVVGELRRAQGLDERTAQAKILQGPAHFYRIWDSHRCDKRVGVWWFSEQLLQRCRIEAGPDQHERLMWLRGRLAVSLDWSTCDRVDHLQLTAGDELPAIQAVGLPRRAYSPSGWSDPNTSMRDYWRKIDCYFQGGATQIVLPWVPQNRTLGLPRL